MKKNKSSLRDPSEDEMVLIQSELIEEQMSDILDQAEEIQLQQQSIANLVGGEPGGRLPDPWW
tara:strand:- start:1384 stop:1572 length:189 start_codon:yes stop_codon:yes gene_type:complete